jgi:cardiolipin synthase A/B
LSLVGNYEINLAVYSTALAQQMSALFAEDSAERFELTLEQWESRPWSRKVSERILAPWRFMM